MQLSLKLTRAPPQHTLDGHPGRPRVGRQAPASPAAAARQTRRGPMGKPLPVALALPALAAAPAVAAAPPYPASDLGITWDTSTYRSAGRGGDIWPVTTGADGQMHTAWGDGRIGCPATVSYGTATIAAGRGGDPLR